MKSIAQDDWSKIATLLHVQSIERSSFGPFTVRVKRQGRLFREAWHAGDLMMKIFTSAHERNRLILITDALLRESNSATTEERKPNFLLAATKELINMSRTQ